MELWNGIKIRNRQKEIMIKIYRFRSLTTEHIRLIKFGQLIPNASVSEIDIKLLRNSQKSNISRDLNYLIEQKLVEPEVIDHNTNEKIFCLTLKGVEFVKSHIEINENDPLAGFINVHGDFSASQLKNNLTSIKHHKMYLDFVTNLNLPTRHNLYAVKYYKNNTLKVCPDGEILNRSGGIIAVEIDTGSERFDQLVSKFENYYSYFNDCIKQKKELPWIRIHFVTQRKDTKFQEDRRCHTIFKAAVSGLRHFCWRINVTVHNHSLLKYLRENPTLLEEKEISIPPLKDETTLEKTRELLQLEKRRDELLYDLENEKRKKAKKLEMEFKQMIYDRGIIAWGNLAESERMVKKGLFTKVENVEKKKQFISNFVLSKYQEGYDGYYKNQTKDDVLEFLPDELEDINKRIAQLIKELNE